MHPELKSKIKHYSWVLKDKIMDYWTWEMTFLSEKLAERPEKDNVYYILYSPMAYYKDLARHYALKWGYRLLHSPIILLYYLVEAYYKVKSFVLYRVLKIEDDVEF